MAGGKFNLTQKGLILVAIPLIIELIFFGSLIGLLNQTEIERNDAEHAHAMIAQVNMMLASFYNASADLLPGALNSPEAAEASDFNSKLDDIRAKYHDLQGLAINPDEAVKVNSISPVIEHFISVIDEVHVLVGQLGKDFGSVKQLQRRRKQITRLVKEIKSQMETLLAPDMEVQRRSSEVARRQGDQLKAVIYAGLAGNILLALIGWRLFSQHIVKRLETLIENSRKIAMNETLPNVVSGEDEIADLDIALHNMADILADATETERALVDNVSDVICSLDANNRFVAVNPACVQAWGYTEDDLLGLNVRELIVNEEAAKVIQNLSSLDKDHKETKNFDTRVKLKNGEEADMHWTVSWSPNQRSFFCVVHDVSAQKQIERMKKEFVAMVSHDLRTPLNSVLNLLTLMSVDAYGEVNETGHQRIDAAEQDVTRLIGLINGLLDLEKLESGEIALDIKPCNVDEIIEQAKQSVYGFAQQNGVEITSETSGLRLSGDHNRLVQVLINLLSNAIKFSEKGSAVRLRAEHRANYTVLEVADSGCGIPEDVQSTIFERFQQAEGANKKHKGTGLGLAICKNIAEQHGGSIGVDSKVGVGSTFWVKIPDGTSQM